MQTDSQANQCHAGRIQSIESLAHTDLTRQERLKLWLWKNNLPQSDLAREMGVSNSTVSYWIRREHLPSWRVAQLRKFGIPEDLLPKAIDIPSGPKSKWKPQVEATFTPA